MPLNLNNGQKLCRLQCRSVERQTMIKARRINQGEQNVFQEAMQV